MELRRSSMSPCTKPSRGGVTQSPAGSNPSASDDSSAGSKKAVGCKSWIRDAVEISGPATSRWPHDLYELTSCKRQQSGSFKTCNCRLVSAGEISSLSSCRSPRRPELHACKLPGMRCTLCFPICCIQCSVLSNSIKMRMPCPFCMQWWHLGQACMPE